MTNDNTIKDPNVKQPGEKPEGTQHYNPGNQSGKSQSVPPDRQKPDESCHKSALRSDSYWFRRLLFKQNDGGFWSVR